MVRGPRPPRPRPPPQNAGNEDEPGPPGDGEGGIAAKPAGAVAEGLEAARGFDSESDDDCGPESDPELAALFASGDAVSYYAGPSPRQMLRWRRHGAAWCAAHWRGPGKRGQVWL